MGSQRVRHDLATKTTTTTEVAWTEQVLGFMASYHGKVGNLSYGGIGSLGWSSGVPYTHFPTVPPSYPHAPGDSGMLLNICQCGQSI